MGKLTISYSEDNQQGLKAIKALAKVFDMKVKDEKADQASKTSTAGKGEPDHFFINGKRVEKAKRKMDIKELAGSLTHLNLDAKELRKLWQRKF